MRRSMPDTVIGPGEMGQVDQPRNLPPLAEGFPSAALLWMEERMTNRSAVSDPSTVIPSGLYCAKITAAKVGIPERRLLDLAADGYMPCYHIEWLEEPVFKINEVKSYMKGNCILKQNGNPLPPERITVVLGAEDPRLAHHEIPYELTELTNHLRKFCSRRYPPCIYFLARASKIVYVGQTIALPVRIAQHAENGKDFDSVYYLMVPRERLNDTERAFIQILKPELNKENFKEGNDPISFGVLQSLLQEKEPE